MKTYTNKSTGLKFDVADDKVDWFERDADFVEFFEEPEVIVIKPKKKKITVKKSKVTKKVLKPDNKKKY